MRWREIGRVLTDCDVDRISLVGYDRYIVCGHDGEFVSVETYVDPVVDSDVDNAEEMRFSWTQCGLCIFATECGRHGAVNEDIVSGRRALCV